MALKLDDSRWWNGDFEPFTLMDKTVSTPIEAVANLGLEDGLCCTTCRISVGDDRFSLVMHYRSEWHRYNLRRKLHGKSVIPEQDFEETHFNFAESSDRSSNESSDEEISLPFSEGAEEYFVHDRNVFSIHKCILFKGEQVSHCLFNRPLDCAIFLLAGGHFCGGIFKNNQLITHKTFHRYTVRAKQGGTQSVADAKSGAKKSAGAALRRYNEKALKEDIEEFFEKSSKAIQECPLIFIRAPVYNRSLFVSESYGTSPFLKSDERLRTIPFVTYRPSFDELMRIWHRLRVVKVHGNVDDFRKVVEEKRSLKKKRVTLQLTRQPRGNEKSFSDISDSKETPTAKLLRKQDHVEEDFKSVAQTIANFDEAGCLTEEQKQTIYFAVRTDSLEKLREILVTNSDKRLKIIDYLQFAHFSPDGSSFLHIAARRESRNVLMELLHLGCNPCLKDAAGLAPYEVANSRSIKRIFSKYRSQNPDLWDWKVARIPELKVVSEEKLQKEAERRKLQKERRRQREKAKKEEERIEKEQQAERNAFLALSDREKRALAAERRLAAAFRKTREVVREDGNRCFQCGRILPAVPFEYNDNRFCQVLCVKEHRQTKQRDGVK